MRCICMSKKNKNILKRVLSKISNLFQQPGKKSFLEENNKHLEVEKSSSLISSKASKSEEKVLREKYKEAEDSVQVELNDEVKSESYENKETTREKTKEKTINLEEFQIMDSSAAIAEDNVDDSEIHIKVEKNENINIEEKKITPSKIKHDSTEEDSSRKDISETHTLINPKEYLELEYKIIEIRKAKTKSAPMNPKNTFMKDKKSSDVNPATHFIEELENRLPEESELREEKSVEKLGISKNQQIDETQAESKQSEVMPSIEEDKNKSLEEHKKTDTITFNEVTDLEVDLEWDMDIEEKELHTKSSEELDDLDKDAEVTSLIKKEENKQNIERKSTKKELSDTVTKGSLFGVAIDSKDNLEMATNTEEDELNEEIDVEEDFDMRYEEEDFLAESSDDDKYETTFNYKETLQHYEEQIENMDDDDYDDFDLDDLFSDEEFQKELSEVTYSNTNDYTENSQVIQKYQEDPTNQQIFSDIVEKNQPLVKKVVQRYLGAAANTSMTYDDLVSAGNIGMFKAIEKFDPSSGFQFSTYATHWIAQGITRTIADEGRMIRVPVHQVDNILKLTKIENKMVQDHVVIDDNRIMTEMEINRKKLDEIRYVRDTYKVVASMDIPIGDGEGSTLGQFITPDQLVYSGHQTYLESPSDRVENEVFSEELIEWMTTKLTEQELDIVIRRNGLQGNEPETLEAIGIDYGVTRERIRQIEARSYKKLRKTIKSFIKID